jgi:hypothetical protein
MPQALHRQGGSTAYCPGSYSPLDIHRRSVSYEGGDSTSAGWSEDSP